MTAPTTFVAHGGALDDWLERRRALGLDKRDEIWDGIYHVTPHAHASHARLAIRLVVALHGRAAQRGLEGLAEFNLGVENDFRVPDLAFVPVDAELQLYVPTATIVVEIVSPDDASRAKVPFYLARGVREVWLVDPEQRTVEVVTPEGASHSQVLDLTTGEVAGLLGW
ncbi:Uma2 family endonuclease [Kineococcus rhizosphaerae]|uniref:Uma2 family endonuclease n=1 Tax=Kineococcus rhizosphaerae TaxID=559628 RepID=A0A2T0QZR8_9ACTN|nr:Uma2 family endonuclease [Kineococcus rhizosphaerae]PRY12115.1 Uma2 family endonuclease [Kineococcus rhizosphaerae]